MNENEQTAQAIASVQAVEYGQGQVAVATFGVDDEVLGLWLGLERWEDGSLRPELQRLMRNGHCPAPRSKNPKDDYYAIVTRPDWCIVADIEYGAYREHRQRMSETTLRLAGPEPEKAWFGIGNTAKVAKYVAMAIREHGQPLRMFSDRFGHIAALVYDDKVVCVDEGSDYVLEEVDLSSVPALDVTFW